MKKAITFIIILSAFTGAGSIYQLAVVPYVVVASTIIITILVTFNKINEKYLPYYIFGLALSLIWQTSMLGNHLVGVDIHSEYYVTLVTIRNGWNLEWGNIGNTSIILTVLAPLFAKAGFDPIWQFKALYPFICAFTPLILYLAFKRYFGYKRAYLSVLFFMIMPMFTMEAVSMVKSQVAYLFLAGVVWGFTSNLSVMKKTALVTLCAVGTIISHYTVGIITCLYLIGISFALLITNFGKLKTFMGIRTYPMKMIFVVAMVSVLFMVSWFTLIGNGGILGVSSRVFRAVAYNLGIIETPVTDAPSIVVSESGTVNEDEVPDEVKSFIDTKVGLVSTALGLDFINVSVSGKIFRIIQYFTQFSIIIGLFVLWNKRKYFNIKAEYGAGVVGSFLLILCALFIPYFNLMTTTTTRLYMITLFFISPLFIIGIEWLLAKGMRCANIYT